MKRQKLFEDRNYPALSGARKILLALMMFLTSASMVFAQKTITGTVKGADQAPLPGVSVVVKGTTTGTLTDINGKYSLQIPADAKTIVFTFVGMADQEIAVGSSNVYDITLAESTVGLDEVVVVGYGTQSRARLTTSISKLDTKVLQNVSYANVGSSLQGTISGLTVQTTTGMPGASPRIIIRGGTSINNPNGATPLYIIDGVIRPDMNDVDQSDIESIQVLKDAAATSIYGARGSNGVVIIVTKSGKSGRTVINYRYDLTTSENVDDLNLLGAKDYIYFQRMGIMASAERKPSQLTMLTQANSAGTGNDLTNLTAFSTQYLTDANKYKLSEGWQSMPDPADPSKTIIFSDTDFQSKLFQTGIAHNHYLSASGGNEKGTFSTGIGYLNQDGIVITSKYQRLTAHLNGDLKVGKRLSVNGRFNYTNSSNNEPPTGTNLFGRTQGIPPSAKYKYEDGTLASGVNTSLGNPEYVVNYVEAKNSFDRLSSSLGAHLDILPGLSFDPQVSLFQTVYDGRYFEKAYYNGPKAYNTDRNANGSFIRTLQKQADAFFAYTKDINVHHFDIKAGYSFYGTMTRSLYASGKGAATDLISTLNASATPVSVSGTEAQQNIFGYVGRINYDYNEKYLFSLNARYDGASNLGAGNKWGFFPGVSVGWNVDREEFWKVIPEKLLKMKIRGSYGINGNIGGLGYTYNANGTVSGNGFYTSQGSYSVGSRYNGAAAVQNTALANSELQWEQSKTLDFGFDLNVFDGRIGILFDWYKRETENLLASLSLPQSTGFSSILTNLGTLENKGVELELRASVMPRTSEFQWRFL